MQLTGKNAEYADLILSKLMDNGGWISKDEILGILHDTYDYAAEPEFVLHDLVDNWKFIIVDGEILRLTKEGDKVACSDSSNWSAYKLDYLSYKLRKMSLIAINAVAILSMRTMFSKVATRCFNFSISIPQR